MQINKVYVGNNLDVLKTFEDNSVDSIVTDPPYGLGKEPKAHEVLKDWLEKGYHEISGKGFMGKEWDAFVPQPILWKECLRVLKPGGHLLSFAGTRTYDWIVMGLRLSGFEIRDQIAWLYGSGFPKSMNIEKAIESHIKNGKSNSKALKKTEQEGNGKSYKLKGKNNGIMGEDKTYDRKEFIPSTEEAKQWQGYGTALKPALEPIVMARKPLEGTVANNVLKHGVGGINIDGCRVGLNGEEQPTGSGGAVRQSVTEHNWGYVGNGGNQTHELGRFPANVIHDGSDEVVSLFPNSDSSGKSDYNYELSNQNNNTKIVTNIKSGIHFGDSGNASRFFYTAKASQSERNFGLSGFEDNVTTDGRKKSIDNAFNRGETKRKNIHPTVKPIDLMQYLVRLVTPKGGICLDPYLGSGTTAIACKSEKINYIGIELEPEYAKIAEARIKAETVQYDIFDFLEDK